MRYRFALAIASCVIELCVRRVLAAETGARAAARDDLKAMQGTWERVAMELQGKPAPNELIDGWKSTYEGDRLTLSNKEGIYRHCIVTLDPARMPKAVNTWDTEGPAADQTLSGIYELSGDRLKLCFALPGKPRPTEFTTKSGTGSFYFEYKRVESKPLQNAKMPASTTCPKTHTPCCVRHRGNRVRCWGGRL